MLAARSRGSLKRDLREKLEKLLEKFSSGRTFSCSLDPRDFPIEVNRAVESRIKSPLMLIKILARMLR